MLCMTADGCAAFVNCVFVLRMCVVISKTQHFHFPQSLSYIFNMFVLSFLFEGIFYCFHFRFYSEMSHIYMEGTISSVYVCDVSYVTRLYTYM